MSGYSGNSTVQWTGVWDLTNVTGQGSIGIKLGGFAAQFGDSQIPGDSHFGFFSLSNESMTIGAEKNYWIVNSTFSFLGANQPQGKINGTVVAQDSYVNICDAWLIARETWNFTRYNAQFFQNPSL